MITRLGGVIFRAIVVLAVAVFVLTQACEPRRSTEHNQQQDGHRGPATPTYRVEAEVDPRTTGRWMVYAVGEDTTDPATVRHFVTCWRDSDLTTFRDVDIIAQVYREYLRNPDTGSIPCPDTGPAQPPSSPPHHMR